MKKIGFTILFALFQIVALAQRGKVRPEWDLDGGGSVSHHSIDDDMWGFFLLIGIIIVVFIYSAIKGSKNRTSKEENSEVESNKSSMIHDYNGEYIQMGSTADCYLEEDVQSLSEEESTTKIEKSFNEWIPYGKAKNLKEIWNEQYPGLYDKIDGNLAVVIPIKFASGEVAYRLSIPLKDGKTKELKLAKSKLEGGDKVDIPTIVGIELRKKGYDPIIRYDGELFYSTEVSVVEKDIAKKDRYGIKYSSDSKRLLYASPRIESFSIRKSTVVICDNAFSMCDNIVSISIPDGIRKIGKEASSFCPALESIDIPNSVIEIGDNVFAGCKALSEIIIENGTRNKFEELLPEYIDLLKEDGYENENMWEPCGDSYALKDIWEVQFPDQDMYGNIDGDVAEIVSVNLASGNTALRIEIPFKDGTSVQLKLANGDYEEGDKVYISSITGQKLQKKGCDPIVRYSGELYFSTEVTEEDLDNAWTDEYGVKYSADNKRLLKAPNNLNKYLVRSGTTVICNNAFSQCRELQSIQIPNSVTTIGDFAFYNCGKLTYANIPQSVTNLGMCVFEGCKRLPHYHPFE